MESLLNLTLTRSLIQMDDISCVSCSNLSQGSNDDNTTGSPSNRYYTVNTNLHNKMNQMNSHYTSYLSTLTATFNKKWGSLFRNIRIENDMFSSTRLRGPVPLIIRSRGHTISLEPKGVLISKSELRDIIDTHSSTTTEDHYNRLDM